MKGKAKREEVEEAQVENVKDEMKIEEVEQTVVQDVEHKKDSLFKKEFSAIYLVILGVILIAAVSFWGAISFGYMENPLAFIKENQPVHTQLTQNTPKVRQSSPESSESAKFRKDLKIQILNGSGIAGQAGKLKDQLEDLGYKNIEVGNAEERNNKITDVKFGKNISSEDKKTLIEELKKTLAEVKSEDQAELGFDVVITTGSYK